MHKTMKTRLCFLGWALVLTLTVARSGAVLAQSPDASYLSSTKLWVEQALAQHHPSGSAPLRMDVTIGSLDSRLRLASCDQIEPYLPTGMRLWGNTRLGLRCRDRSVKWNVFLPITVKAFGPAWVLKNNIVTGQVLTEADAMIAEVDWAEENASVVSDPAQWQGQLVVRPLLAGQALRQGMFKPAQVFQVGSQVKIVARGRGFELTSDAQSLSTGVVGQIARARLEGGRVISGVVLDARTVQLDF